MKRILLLIAKLAPALHPIYRLPSSCLMGSRKREEPPSIVQSCILTKTITAGTLLCGLLVHAVDLPALKDVFANDFLVGGALNTSHFSGVTNAEVQIIGKHFNTITAENAMKWVHLQPRPGEYAFSQADRFVEFGEEHGMTIIGEDYLEKAFQFAQEADPKAELYYNDYSLEGERKRNGALNLVKKLQAAGVKLTGVGLQGHYQLERPSARQIDETIEAFAKLGLKVMITELDVNVLPTPGPGGADVSRRIAAEPKLNPYADGLPEVMEQRLAHRYAELFGIFLKHRESVTRVTFWGVTDRTSWLNHFPVRGRTNYPLLFDRNAQPKPAFDAVVKLRRGASDSE